MTLSDLRTAMLKWGILNWDGATASLNPLPQAFPPVHLGGSELRRRPPRQRDQNLGLLPSRAGTGYPRNARESAVLAPRAAAAPSAARSASGG